MNSILNLSTGPGKIVAKDLRLLYKNDERLFKMIYAIFKYIWFKIHYAIYKHTLCNVQENLESIPFYTRFSLKFSEYFLLKL